MTIASEFNEEVLRIWTRMYDKMTLMPAQYPDNHFEDSLRLLVIGMNPSFGVGWIQRQISEKLLIQVENAHLIAEEVYQWDPIYGPRNFEHLMKIEMHAFDEYRRYFGPLRAFSDKVGCLNSYSHLDLFHCRWTNQQTFKRTLFDGRKLSDFAVAQIDLTRATLLRIRPKAVVIANAEASRVAVRYLKLEYVDDLQTQCILPSLPETRFFLSGMLSGGAMDEFSHRRLVSDVRRYIFNP